MIHAMMRRLIAVFPSVWSEATGVTSVVESTFDRSLSPSTGGMSDSEGSGTGSVAASLGFSEAVLPGEEACADTLGVGFLRGLGLAGTSLAETPEGLDGALPTRFATMLTGR